MPTSSPSPFIRTNLQYSGSAIPRDYLEKKGLMKKNAAVGEALIMAAIRQKNGLWAILGQSNTGEKPLLARDITTTEMVGRMLKGEEYHLQHSLIFIDTEAYRPDTDMTPHDSEIEVLRYYIEKNELPDNHILHHAFDIGREKQKLHSLLDIMKTSDKNIRKPLPYSSFQMFCN